jgi:hypothetical protein
LAYPVFDSFEDDRFTGVLATDIYWKLFFANILPPSTSLGIICILENSFNQTLTYRIDGPDVTFSARRMVTIPI